MLGNARTAPDAAEEKAHRLPVLLSIPLVTCMLPVMIGVLMLPAVIRTNSNYHSGNFEVTR
jgi:hypothetical protein